MKTVDVLIGARALIKNNWTQSSFYRSDSKCFCALGALRAAGHPEMHREWAAQHGPYTRPMQNAHRYILAVLRGDGYASGLINYNDTRSHEEVLHLFDLAIKRARRRHINGDRKKAVAQ